MKPHLFNLHFLIIPSVGIALLALGAKATVTYGLFFLWGWIISGIAMLGTGWVIWRLQDKTSQQILPDVFERLQALHLLLAEEARLWLVATHHPLADSTQPLKMQVHVQEEILHIYHSENGITSKVASLKHEDYARIKKYIHTSFTPLSPKQVHVWNHILRRFTLLESPNMPLSAHKALLAHAKISAPSFHR